VHLGAQVRCRASVGCSGRHGVAATTACGLRLAAVIHCPPLFPPGLLACPPAMSSTLIPCVSRKDTSSQLPAAPSRRIRAADVTQAGAAPGPAV
jgi:hypothetical protein